MVTSKSRIKNSIRNTLFAAISFIIKAILQFIVRAVFIRYFAVEYLGINGLFADVLNMLSLAELGVGNAIVYSMYKPIADNDIETVKSLVKLYRNVYLIIAFIVGALGVGLIPVLPYLIKDIPNININYTVIYLLCLFQTIVGYLFAYRRSLIFAYQRNDIESKVSIFTQVVLAICQLIVIVMWKNIYIYTLVSVICNSIDAIMVYYFSYKLFPNIKGKARKLDKSVQKEIKKNIGAMMIHKLGGAMVFSTDSIIISSFIGTAILGKYSNYTLVTSAFSSVLTLIITALKSSIGNYISEKNEKDTYFLFKSLLLLFFWFLSIITIGVAVCFQDFIQLYAGNEQYVLPDTTVLLICINFFLSKSRMMVNAFKDGAGLFWNDRFKPIFEVLINLCLDFILVHFWGINGVILATILSEVLVPLWFEPYVLYKNYFKISSVHYFLRVAFYIILTILIGGATYLVCCLIPNIGIGWFVLKCAICILIPNIIFIVFHLKTEEFKYLLNIKK